MSGRDLIESGMQQALAPDAHAPPCGGVVTGELVAIADEGRTPLVMFPGQPGTAAVRARSVVDLHGAHIGAAVVLMFEEADAARPIVMGVIRGSEGWPLAEQPAQVEIDADGARMVVSAREQMVLRCGKASITLTRAGKVLIQGSYVLQPVHGREPGQGRFGADQLNDRTDGDRPWRS
jgi:hypothetical protein